MELVHAVEGIGHDDVARDAERPDRVPDAQIIDPERRQRAKHMARHVLRPPLIFGRGDHDLRRVLAAELQHFGLERVAVVAAFVERHCLIGPARMLPVQDAAGAEQADERPGRVGAARKAEDVDLVAGRIVEDEEAVAVTEVLDETSAKDAADKRLAFLAPDALVIECQLGRAIAGDRHDAFGGQQHIGGVGCIQSAPTAVETKYQPLHVCPLSPRPGRTLSRRIYRRATVFSRG